MTIEEREDAIDIIQSILNKYEEDECLVTEITIGDEDIKAFKMAIEALAQEPCEDAISRKAVINQIFYSTDNNGDVVLGSALRERITRLLPVTPQEPRWIPVSENLPKEGGDYLVTLCFDIYGKTVREVRKNFFCILSKKMVI
jgi:hypothetical protein